MGRPWQSHPGTYGASKPAIDRDFTTRSLRILLSAVPMWIWPFAYGGPSCRTKRGPAAARLADPRVQAGLVPTRDGRRLGHRQVRLHREVRSRKVERLFPVAHVARNPHSIIGAVARPAAVFFDVDFTLIHPGPRFQGVGYEANCARHGVAVDPARFDAAVAGRGLRARSRSRRPDLRRAGLSELHPPHHRADGRHRPGGRRRLARDVRRLGPASSFFALRRRRRDAEDAQGAGPAARAHLEHPPLPGVVPVALRSRPPDFGRGLVVRARVHEAAPEHLPCRAGADGRRGGRRRHGGRQPAARRARRKAGRHAQRPHRARGATGRCRSPTCR